MYEALMIASTLQLADAGLPDVVLAKKIEYGGNGTLWIDWHDRESAKLGQVVYTDQYEFIQIHFLG